MRRTIWIALGLAVAAASCESGPSPIPTPKPNEASPPPVPAPDLRSHMALHLDAAATLQRAIAHGRLTEARDTAAWFANHDIDAPLEWRPFVDEMRYAALRVKHAHDVATAGIELGRFGRACGACHEAIEARPVFASQPYPHGMATDMARHQWAAARLWEGLIGPDDARWSDGARAMTTVRFDIGAAVHDKPNADVIELGERLHARARQALSTTEPAARAKLYGEMMDTCASCHAVVRPQPAAMRR